MDLDLFLKKTQVIKVKSTEKQTVIKEMIEKLQELGFIDNKERYYAQIIHRESLENTSIGNNFAIPHARTESVSEFITIFGICDEEIDFHNEDDNPVKYVLLSIFPSRMSTTYLYFIGMMARIFSNIEKKALLDVARTPAKTYDLLKKEAESYFDSISEKEIIPIDSAETLSGVPSSDLDILIRLDRLYKVYDSEKKSEQITKKIERLKKLIDNRSLTYFERMRKKSDSPFAIVEKGSCSGCHMEIPPVYMRQIKERQGISVCTHCGRFLILV